MVAQKISVSPQGGDDIGIQYDYIERHGFFANESQNSQFIESNRDRSVKVRKEPESKPSLRSCDRPKNGNSTLFSNDSINANNAINATANYKLFRGKKESAEFLKPEPVYQSTMQDLDAEFFQDLIQWCDDTSTEQEVVQSIDPTKTTDTRAHTTDTQHTQFPSLDWDVIHNNYPIAQSSSYNPTPPSFHDSPVGNDMAAFNTDFFGSPTFMIDERFSSQEQFLDIDKLPVVIGDLASETIADSNPWITTEPVWHNTYDYMKPHTDIHTMPFIDQEDSLDMKMMSVIPREVENDVVISEYILSEAPPRPSLALDVAARPWTNDVISTPEVLTYVEQLEKEKCPPVCSAPISPSQYTSSPAPSCAKLENSPPSEYEPITPKSEPPLDSEEDNKSSTGKRQRHDSEESDESYTPYEQTTRRYKRRKPSIPIKDMIRALEGSQQLTKARRGRPPKRRESTISNVSENSSSVSTHEIKYRELRDKNNEASKRSRMNRKLKELQMEQLADELEERNKKLRVRADLLEDMTKKLREAFMAAVAKSKVR